MKYIPLTRGMEACVDDENYDELIQYKWMAVPSGNTWYAARQRYIDGKRRYQQMHRDITNPPKKMDVDHINHNGLDNRKENLRVCTHAQNQCNRQANSGSPCNFKGVTWDKANNKWIAQICAHGRHRYLGRHFCLVKAAKKYDAAAIRYFGEFAKLNFPPPSKL